MALGTIPHSEASQDPGQASPWTPIWPQARGLAGSGGWNGALSPLVGAGPDPSPEQGWVLLHRLRSSQPPAGSVARQWHINSQRDLGSWAPHGDCTQQGTEPAGRRASSQAQANSVTQALSETEPGPCPDTAPARRMGAHRVHGGSPGTLSWRWEVMTVLS